MRSPRVGGVTGAQTTRLVRAQSLEPCATRRPGQCGGRLSGGRCGKGWAAAPSPRGDSSRPLPLSLLPSRAAAAAAAAVRRRPLSAPQRARAERGRGRGTWRMRPVARANSAARAAVVARAAGMPEHRAPGLGPWR